MEDRTLLAATLTVDASDGGAVMVDSAEYCEVVVTSAADIGTLTVNGDSSEIRVEIRGGASVSSVQFNGGAGAETLFVEGDVGPITFNGGGGDDVLTIAGGAMVNQLTYDGGDGADDLNIGGSVQGTVSVQGGAGRDRVFINGGQIGGDVGGNLGDGNDQFRLRSGGQVVNFDVDFGDGQNRFVLNSGGQVDGNFKYTGGRGSDTIRLVGEQGATEIDGNFEAILNQSNDRLTQIGSLTVMGNMTIDANGGDDRIAFEGLTLDGNQTINTGSSQDDDSVIFGDDDIDGESIVNAKDGLDITERASREIRSDYSIKQQQTDAEANIFLDEESVIAGNFSLSTKGATTFKGRFTVEQGNAKINTGDAADTVSLLSGTRIEGNLQVNLGGGSVSDALLMDDGPVEVTGNQTVNVGSGADEVRFAGLTLMGNQNIKLGTSDGGTDIVSFAGTDDIDGSSKITAGGDFEVTSTGSRNIQSDYTIQGSNGGEATIMLAAATIVQSNLSVTVSGPSMIVAPVSTQMGNASFTTGSGADTLDLSNLSVGNGNNLNVSTGSGADSVTLTGASVTGNSNVGLSGGDDEVDNTGFTVQGTPTFTGGGGFDTITNPNQGSVSGFEG